MVKTGLPPTLRPWVEAKWEPRLPASQEGEIPQHPPQYLPQGGDTGQLELGLLSPWSVISPSAPHHVCGDHARSWKSYPTQQ